MFRGGERSVGLVVIRDVVVRTALGRPATETARMLRGTFGVILRFVSAGVCFPIPVYPVSKVRRSASPPQRRNTTLSPSLCRSNRAPASL